MLEHDSWVSCVKVLPAAGAGAAVWEPPHLQKVPVSQRGAEHPSGPAQQPQTPSSHLRWKRRLVGVSVGQVGNGFDYKAPSRQVSNRQSP